MKSRVVTYLPQELKRRLYSLLAGEGRTMKEWINQQAESYCSQKTSSGTGFLPFESPEPRGTRRRTSQKTTFKIASMFSGCGGMDLGFEGGFRFLGRDYASQGFKVVWANELSPDACETYRLNLKGPIRCGDVWDEVDTIPEDVDVVIGGFPCQDISVNNKNARGVDGARSGLYRAMVHAVGKVQPKVFVAENVKGLLMRNNSDSLARVLRDFGNLGYRVQYQLYNSADYGVPQTRERVLIVGVRDDQGEFTPPERVLERTEWITCQRAIGDLADRDRCEVSSHIWSHANKSPEQGSRRLKANRPGYTVRAECHGNIHFHYALDRRMSMREAARIQSFPDTFQFASKLRKTERQIGNAVPPVLAWHLAKAVRDCLEASSVLT